MLVQTRVSRRAIDPSSWVRARMGLPREASTSGIRAVPGTEVIMWLSEPWLVARWDMILQHEKKGIAAEPHMP
jgi:hypothetical protein